MNINYELVVSHATREVAEQILLNQKVAVFIVTYNATRHIENTISRIPTWISKNLVDIFIIDDNSTDETLEILKSLKQGHFPNLTIFKTPTNCQSPNLCARLNESFFVVFAFCCLYAVNRTLTFVLSF